MPSFFKSFVLLAVFLSLTNVINAGKCCDGDNTCSGCWMCPGSDLRTCWDQATQRPSQCTTKDDLQTKAQCYCDAYAAIAYCWSQGRCCTEYAPTLAAATDLCNLATYPSSLISSWKLDAAVKEAARVADAIWHNDSGVDVPKCQSHIHPYTGGSSNDDYSKPAPSHEDYTQPTYTGPSPTTGGDNGSYSHNHNDDAAPPQSSENSYNHRGQSYAKGHLHTKSDNGGHHHSNSNNHLKYSHQKSSSEKKSEEKKVHQKHAHEKKVQEKKVHQKHAHEKKVQEKKVHQKNVHEKKVQERDCDQPLQKRSHAKRASYTTLEISSAEYENLKLSKRSVLCGEDFQGVYYPTKVADTVLKAYNQS